MLQHNARRPSAFTLVELLVVIAITALLASILIPTLSQAKEVTYQAMCGNNMHQGAMGLTAYCYDWKESIPPNCSRNDGEFITSGTFAGDNCGPFTTISGGTNTLIGGTSVRGNLARWDNGTDYSYVNGMALMWASGYVPFDMGGARMLWCPAERRNKFNSYIAGYWTTTSPHFAGSSTYGIIDHPFASISLGGATNVNGNWTMISSYTYRALGYDASVTPNLSNCITKGSWRLSNLAKYCAQIDYATQVNSKDTGGNPSTPTFSHGSNNNTYIGTNRMFYDGHAKWLNDTTKTFGQYVGGGAATALPNSSRETVWKSLYDVN